MLDRSALAPAALESAGADRDPNAFKFNPLTEETIMKRLHLKGSIGLLIFSGFLFGAYGAGQNQILAADSSMTGFAQKAFGDADSNGDGVISRSEFDTGRTKTFTEKDSNGDGFMTLTEFKAGLPKFVQSRAESRFNEMDTNHDGKVSRSEHEASGDATFKRLDTNGDGRLTKEELPKFGNGKF